MQHIEKAEWNEYTARSFLDYAIQKVHEKIIFEYQQNNRTVMIQLAHKLAVLQQHLLILPAAGSAKLFLRNLYLALHIQHHEKLAA
jgi:hypothetical protein